MTITAINMPSTRQSSGVMNIPYPCKNTANQVLNSMPITVQAGQRVRVVPDPRGPRVEPADNYTSFQP
jgi:hypothetical protein